MKHPYLDILFTLGRPLSPLYSLIMSARQLAYKQGILHVNRVDRPVVSVGNICLGGTGKTPHVMAITCHLQTKGLKPAVVSRGYGGKAGQGPLVVSDGKACLAKADVCGDEPAMMASAFSGVPIIVGRNRTACAQAAIEHFDSKAIILDDGFQHMGLFRDLDIVLMPAKSPFGTGIVFPGGDLREPPRALKRASAIILTKCEQVPENSLELIRAEVRKVAGSIPIFLSYTVFSGIRMADGEKKLANSLLSPVFCFCGIAMPESFFSIVTRQGLKITGKSSFKDHYQFTKGDLEKIFSMAKKTGAKMTLTTAKDFARLKKLWDMEFKGRKELPPLGIVEIKAEIEASFYSFIDSRLR